MKKKISTSVGIIIIIIVAIIFIGGVFSYQYFAIQKTNNQILGWATCAENTYFNYQFQYPKSWLITIDSNSQGAGDMPPVYKSSCDGANVGLSVGPQRNIGKKNTELEQFSVSAQSLSSTIYAGKVNNIDDYISTVLSDHLYGNVQGNTVVKKMSVGGKQAVLLSDGSIVVVYREAIYEMGFGPKTDSIIENQILSTFKFTK